MLNLTKMLPRIYVVLACSMATVFGEKPLEVVESSYKFIGNPSASGLNLSPVYDISSRMIMDLHNEEFPPVEILEQRFEQLPKASALSSDKALPSPLNGNSALETLAGAASVALMAYGISYALPFAAPFIARRSDNGIGTEPVNPIDDLVKWVRKRYRGTGVGNPGSKEGYTAFDYPEGSFEGVNKKTYEPSSFSGPRKPSSIPSKHYREKLPHKDDLNTQTKYSYSEYPSQSIPLRSRDVPKTESIPNKPPNVGNKGDELYAPNLFSFAFDDFDESFGDDPTVESGPQFGKVTYEYDFTNTNVRTPSSKQNPSDLKITQGKFETPRRESRPSRPAKKIPRPPPRPRPAKPLNIRLPSKPNIRLPSKPNIRLPSKPNIRLPSKPNIRLPSKPNIRLPSKPNIRLPSKPTANPNYVAEYVGDFIRDFNNDFNSRLPNHIAAQRRRRPNKPGKAATAENSYEAPQTGYKPAAKPTPSTSYEPAPAPPSNSYQPAPPSNSYQPGPPSNSYQPGPSSNSYQPAPPSNSYQPAPPSNSYEPAAPSNSYEPAPPSNSYQPAPPSNSYKPISKPEPIRKPPPKQTRPQKHRPYRPPPPMKRPPTLSKRPQPSMKRPPTGGKRPPQRLLKPRRPRPARYPNTARSDTEEGLVLIDEKPKSDFPGYVSLEQVNRLAEEEMEGVVKGYSTRYDVPWPPTEDRSIILPVKDEGPNQYQNYRDNRMGLPQTGFSSRVSASEFTPDYSEFDYVDVRGSEASFGAAKQVARPEGAREIPANYPVSSGFGFSDKDSKRENVYYDEPSSTTIVHSSSSTTVTHVPVSSSSTTEGFMPIIPPYDQLPHGENLPSSNPQYMRPF